MTDRLNTTQSHARGIISFKITGERPFDRALEILDDLADHGYVIFHEDDIPAEQHEIAWGNRSRRDGWNAYRAALLEAIES